ncbi:MAG TPA: amidohydrolase [Nonomuraea sp.]|nr:amidohydrolase [Nonomuraea sp.]
MPAAEIVFHGGTVIPMTGPEERAQSIAIDQGRIVAIGSDEELQPLRAKAAAEVDLRGASVIPGLIDTHVHLVRTGLSMIGPVLPAARTVPELLDNVRHALRDVPGPEPLICHGGGVRWFGDRDPTRWDLDAVVGARPVLVSDPSAHVSLVSSAALERIGVDDGVRGVEVDAQGEPNGLLVTWANKAARRWFHSQVPDEQIQRGVRMAVDAASRRGVTTIHAMDGGDYLGDHDVPALLRAQAAGDLPVDLVIYPQVVDLAQVAAWGLPRVGGCILLDGAYGEHTAALREPYTDAPGARGVLFHTDDEVERFVCEAHRRGLQVAVHAQGDAAIEQILRAYEKAQAADPRPDHRHRIEHCGLPTRDQLERIAALGIGLGMQPVFAPAHPSLEAMFGAERVARRHRYRDIVDLGIVIGGGSDADSSPIDPFLGIQTLATLDAERRLSHYEALQLFTSNAAYMAFEEHAKGSLRPGQRADFVVFNTDPESGTITIQETWFKGRPSFQPGNGRTAADAHRTWGATGGVEPIST